MQRPPAVTTTMLPPCRRGGNSHAAVGVPWVELQSFARRATTAAAAAGVLWPSVVLFQPTGVLEGCMSMLEQKTQSLCLSLFVVALKSVLDCNVLHAHAVFVGVWI